MNLPVKKIWHPWLAYGEVMVEKEANKSTYI
jgi:hypothetical protein